MGTINTEHLERCLETFKKSYVLLNQTQDGSIDYEIYRNSLIKGFEMTLEQAGKLLKKRITPYFATKKEVDKLTFKDIFRNALKHALLSEEETLRWFEYRDNRNNTAHDYGQKFADITLGLIDNFILDTENLIRVINND